MAHGMPRLDVLRALRRPDELPQRLLGHRADRRRRGAARSSRCGCARGSPAAARRDAELARIPRRARPSAPRRGPARRASRSAWRPTSRRSSCSARQVDSIRAQTHARLGLRHQRRLLGARALRRDRGGGRATTRASCSRAPRAGSASTATSSARWRSRRRARATSRWPTRTTPGTRTSSRRCWPSSATRGSSTATPGSSARDGRAARRHVLEPARATTTPTCCRCWWRTRSPAPRRCSRATLLDDALPFPPAQFAHFHDHWLALVRARRSATSRSSTGRSTTTSSTAARRSATRPPTACRAARAGRARCAATRASGSGCGACTTSSTPAGCCSSPPCCELRCGDADGAPPSAARSTRFERADRSLAAARRGSPSRGARELARPPPRDARGGVDAVPRVRVAPAARRPAPATGRSARARLDALPPPALDPRPGARAPAEPALRALAEKIAPLRLAVARRRAARGSTC